MKKILKNLKTIYMLFIFTAFSFGGNAKGEMLEKPGNHAKELADKYHIPETTVSEMRDGNQGWGEIETQLALAERLSQTEPVKYPEFEDALNHVEGMRDEGKGYGQIAHELGFKLGDVVSESKTESLDSVKEDKENLKFIRKNNDLKEAKENAKSLKEAAKEISREAKENAKSSRDAAKEAKDSAKAFRDAAKEAKKEAKEHSKSKKS